MGHLPRETLFANVGHHPKTGQVHNGTTCSVEGVYRIQSRRHFTPEFKTRVVLDLLTGVQSQAEICRKHTLSPNLVALWRCVSNIR